MIKLSTWSVNKTCTWLTRWIVLWRQNERLERHSFQSHSLVLGEITDTTTILPSQWSQVKPRCAQCPPMWRLVLVYIYQTSPQHKQLSHTQTMPYKQQKTISNKNRELKQLSHTIQPDFITVQETKLTTSKSQNISNCIPIHTDRVSKLGRIHLFIKIFLIENTILII